MRARRIWASVAAAVMVVGGVSLALAPMATADTTWSGTVTSSSTNIQSGYTVQGCGEWGPYPNPIYSESTTFTPAADGNYTFTVTSALMNGNPATVTVLSLFSPTYSEADCVESVLGLPLASLTANLTGGTTYLLVFWGDSGVDGGVTTTGTFSVDLLDSGTATAAAPPIPDWVQAYGRDGKDATCLDGWSPSWESWAEPVTGGWVCTRSIPSLG